MAPRQPEGCYASLVFAMLSNNFFQIPARAGAFESAAPHVFPTECQ
jgi:hypothetical protein